MCASAWWPEASPLISPRRWNFSGARSYSSPASRPHARADRLVVAPAIARPEHLAGFRVLPIAARFQANLEHVGLGVAVAAVRLVAIGAWPPFRRRRRLPSAREQPLRQRWQEARRIDSGDPGLG